jgi:low affinity Fe/Cu permease
VTTSQERVESSWSLRAVAATTSALGSIPAIAASVAIIVVWAVTGPLFGFSDTWQLIINTFTTLVTFVMVFVIQSSQNRDGRAIQVKLDEILRAMARADNELVGIEDLPESEIKEIQDRIRSSTTEQ